MLRSFQVEVEVDPKHHPKIIGRRGTIITRIRQDHEVQIQLPERGSDREAIIVVTGYEDNAKAARDEILGIVRELVSPTQNILLRFLAQMLYLF